MASPQEAPNTVQQYLEREDEDESVRKWKESLLGDAAGQDMSLASPADDPRLVIVKEFKVVVENGPTYTYDLTTEEGLAELKKGYKLKEGCTFHFELTFHVHHQIVLGLVMKNASKKLVASKEEVFTIGSYPPTIAPIVKVMEECEVPAGFFARGKYDVTATIEDQMGREHFKFDYKFEITKE